MAVKVVRKRLSDPEINQILMTAKKDFSPIRVKLEGSERVLRVWPHKDPDTGLWFVWVGPTTNRTRRNILRCEVYTMRNKVMHTFVMQQSRHNLWKKDGSRSTGRKTMMRKVLG